MKIKKLSKKDKDWIIDIYSNSKSKEASQEIIAKKFGVTKRAVRNWLKALGVTKSSISPSFLLAQKKELEKKKFYIVTWAQNSTPVHKEFMNNIEAYAKHLDAEISVIAGRYKNPTSSFPDANKEVWDNRIMKYLDANRQVIHPYIEILSDIKVQPTARAPLSSFEGVSEQRSCIIGHPRVHLSVIPALKGYVPKMMLTTGACTVSNYTDSKAGKIGDFHHTLGFCIVETNKDDFYVRQVTANENGAFTDLTNYVSNSQVTKSPSIKSMVMGDIHVGDHDVNCINATLELCSKLKPKTLVLHDLFNGHSINKHELKNAFSKFIKEQENKHSLEKEINDVIDFVNNLSNRTSSYCKKIVVVNSNHDAWIENYLINSDWKKDITNAMEYMKYSTMLLSNEASKGVLANILENRAGCNVLPLGIDESYRVGDWEYGVHGHLGTSGSRGSSNQFKKLSTKMIIGHSHVPNRIDGVVTVGTSTKLRVGYNKGASAWLQSHAIHHADDKVQQVHCINYNFTNLL